MKPFILYYFTVIAVLTGILRTNNGKKINTNLTLRSKNSSNREAYDHNQESKESINTEKIKIRNHIGEGEPFITKIITVELTNGTVISNIQGQEDIVNQDFLADTEIQEMIVKHSLRDTNVGQINKDLYTIMTMPEGELKSLIKQDTKVKNIFLLDADKLCKDKLYHYIFLEAVCAKIKSARKSVDKGLK